MPPIRSTTLSTHVVAYHSPTEFLDNVSSALSKYERLANIIIPHAEKLRRAVQSGKPIAKDQFWLACWSIRGSSQPALDFVLSCTETHMGAYPIFIASTLPSSTLTPTFLDSRMALIIDKLLELVPPERVFSVFALAPVTKSFVAAWTDATSFVAEEEPWYAARSTYLTRETFKKARQPSDPEHTLRRATLADLDRAAVLCKEFADTSPPFTLDDKRARKEALAMIEQEQMWVYEMSLTPNDPREIASIVCVTRSSQTVAGITKVYTTHKYRKRGCADRLLAKVCQHIFSDPEKRSIVLFVGHTLDAVRVYDRIGFAGLCGKPRDEKEGVEDWLEIGFKDTRIGHW